MRRRIALAATAIALATHPSAAQSRGAQLTTGLSLASLGAWAAFADGDCSNDPLTVLQNGRCEWRTLGGRYLGVPPELPRRQMAVGLAAAGIGGLMAGGAWAPSRTVDALATAGAGVMLLTVARNENYVPGTVPSRAAMAGGSRYARTARGPTAPSTTRRAPVTTCPSAGIRRSTG